MKPNVRKQHRRLRRKRRVRRKVSGTDDRPRLTVFRSHKNISAQIINDMAGHTLVAASSQEKAVSGQLPGGGGNKQAAQAIGLALAQKAVKAGIKKVVFDRNGYAYHGRVRALAEAAREGGLEF